MRSLSKRHALLINKICEQSERMIEMFGEKMAFSRTMGSAENSVYAIITPESVIFKLNNLYAHKFLEIHFDIKSSSKNEPKCSFTNTSLQFTSLGIDDQSVVLTVNGDLKVSTDSELMDVEEALFALNVQGKNIDKTAEEVLETVNTIGEIRTKRPVTVNIQLDKIDEKQFEVIALWLHDEFLKQPVE